ADRGSRTVSEQEGGRPIIPVDVTREAVGSYQEDVPGRSRRERLVGKREPVDEAGAGGIEIERGDWTRAELRLHETGRRRDGVVRRGGGDDEEIDGGGGEPRACAGSARRRRGEARGRGIAIAEGTPGAEARGRAEP